MYLLEGKKIMIVIIGALFNAVAMNLFLIPANIYSSGFTGVAQLISTLLATYAPFTISTGIILFILNVPITIIAWKKVGRSFTVYSFFSVVLMTVFMEVIPVYKMSPDILLNAVFGGVIAAVGVGITLKYGASTGGMDIIAMLLSRVKDKPVGTYLFLLNGVIIVTAGAIYGPEKALYTLVTLYTSTRVIDAIHTRHEKLTAMIITKKGDVLRRAIHSKLVRGITTVPVKGGYTNENKEMLLIVVTRYEQYDLEKIINEVDPHAFTNILQTTGIVGLFRKE
ncbi:YitT family protein [Peribacillus loiseleuriae]|uniref:Membrane protein n=1 Tax=Peribacillus loiseleuriae TaxID=1679170 RepID=A0A0K9GS29_9BACI|nr:YitT family protein [Peribacillus loiseleuriae]KMY49067.1 membrane protein [Peribacillus loiseleuriae]